MPDWFDEKNLSYFREWSGEVRFLQNIAVKRKAFTLYSTVITAVSKTAMSNLKNLVYVDT
jgi:hypothetical protein